MNDRELFLMAGVELPNGIGGTGEERERGG